MQEEFEAASARNWCLVDRIPAKKWGDTEIAERGRSVLVMRACYRSAGLTPYQRGWTDAGWTVSRLQLCNGLLYMQLFLHDSSRKGTLYSTPLVFLLSLSATYGAYTGYMELGSCYLWE